MNHSDLKTKLFSQMGFSSFKKTTEETLSSNNIQVKEEDFGNDSN
jgi:hypothetical protein